MRSKHGKLIDDLVSNIKLTTLASQTKLGSFSFPCELCDYDRDMAGQIKKHVESMHIDQVHTFRSAEKRDKYEHTFVFRLHIFQHRVAAHDDVRKACQICGCGAKIDSNLNYNANRIENFVARKHK